MLINEHVTFGRVADETMIINSENNVAIKLDRQGTEIFELIYDGYSKEEIINHFQRMYPSAGIHIEADVNNFINTLEMQKIIRQ